MTWTIDLVPYGDGEAERLRTAQREELNARYGSDDHEPGTPPSAADVPVFLLARNVDGSSVACAGLRPLDDSINGRGVVEIKRMYVDPSVRGSGVAAALLRALEDQARILGSARIVLETGTMQPDAIRFYEREGYVSIPLYGPYIGSELSVCYGRSL